MGLWGLGGLKSAFSIAQLIGQNIVARTITLTGGTAADVNATGTASALDFISTASGATGLTFSHANGTNRITWGTGRYLVWTAGGFLAPTGGVDGVTAGAFALGASARLVFSSTAPTISSGFGTSPSVVANNGTAAFTINVGTGGVASTGVIALPTATTGWAVTVRNLSSNNATQFLTKQTATTTTTATIGNYDAAGAAAAWAASDVLLITATAY